MSGGHTPSDSRRETAAQKPKWIASLHSPWAARARASESHSRQSRAEGRKGRISRSPEPMFCCETRYSQTPAIGGGQGNHPPNEPLAQILHVRNLRVDLSEQVRNPCLNPLLEEFERARAVNPVEFAGAQDFVKALSGGFVGAARLIVASASPRIALRRLLTLVRIVRFRPPLLQSRSRFRASRRNFMSTAISPRRSER